MTIRRNAYPLIWGAVGLLAGYELERLSLLFTLVLMATFSRCETTLILGASLHGRAMREIIAFWPLTYPPHNDAWMIGERCRGPITRADKVSGTHFGANKALGTDFGHIGGKKPFAVPDTFLVSYGLRRRYSVMTPFPSPGCMARLRASSG